MERATIQEHLIVPVVYCQVVGSPNLPDYKEWLRRRGTGAGTINQYLFHANRALGGEDPFDRITDRSLSPKYRRVCKAAIISFARYQDDDALVKQIKEVKLPAPVRQEVKPLITEDQWRSLREEIDHATYITEPMRCELGLMANRGLRRGDVLRLQRKEITDALRTGTLSYEAKGERRLEFGVLKPWRPYLVTLADEFSAEKKTRTVADLISPKATDETRQAVAGAAVVRALRRVAGRVKGISPGVAPHDLRRCYATLFFEACGRDPVKLQHHLQWANVQTALGYVSAGTRESLDAVAEEMLK